MDINAVWGVEPNYVSWSVSAIMICRDVTPDILKAFTIATGLEGITVDCEALLNLSESQDKSEILLLMVAGRCLIMDGGWLDFALMYSG